MLEEGLLLLRWLDKSPAAPRLVLLLPRFSIGILSAG